MLVGSTVKYCHFCERESLMNIEENAGVVAYICQNPIHKLARQQFEASRDDAIRNRSLENYLRGE